MHQRAVLLSLLAPTIVSAYPWALDIASGADYDVLPLENAASLNKRAGLCPTILKRQGAAPYSSYYPSKYTGARDGQPGNGKGGVLVPAKGDTAHAYKAPGANDIRGPCPGLNTLANHNFISHDGITTYNEMVDAAQNVYNWHYDLASFVATFGLVQDGNPLTQTLSIGCQPSLATANTGLNTHNKFEADMSLSRTDYALSPDGDSYSVNGTLFGEMVNSCGNKNFAAECMAAYDQKRFNESLATNGNFFNGPLTFFVYGTSLLPLNSFANFQSGSPVASVDTIASFWGVAKNADGSWSYKRNEKLPQNWYNRPDAYHFNTIVNQIFAQYQQYPSPLGGNTGKPNTFVGLKYPGFIQDGALQNSSPQGIACLFYQVATIALPTSLLQTLQLGAQQSQYATNKLSAFFASQGCKT